MGGSIMKILLSVATVLVMLTTSIASIIPVTKVSAKVIEPEICHVETWTTSYFIDDDKDTLYPYIECKAEVYNDGKVVYTFWNTHEWDGFATVKHHINIVGTEPYPDNSMEFAFKNKKTYTDESNNKYNCVLSFENKVENYSLWDAIDLNYYPSVYQKSGNYNPAFDDRSEICTYYYDSPAIIGVGSIKCYSEYLPLSLLPVESKLCTITFTPKIDITNTYEFHLFEHSLKITPEMLSGNVVAIPQSKDSESQIKELENKVNDLENQVKALKEENEQLKSESNGVKYDFNGDEVVNTLDLVMFIKYLLSL